MVMPWPGQYSCLQVDFTFARQVISHRPHEHQHQQGALLLHHQHLPSLQHDRRCLLVLVLDRSQLSQYLSDYSQEMGKNVFQAPARVSLAVTTLLAMSTTMASIQVERKFNTKLEKN